MQFQQALALETNGAAYVHEVCSPVTSPTADPAGLTVPLRLSTIVFALQPMEPTVTTYLFQTLLDAAMEPSASHTTATVVRLQPPGDGSRLLVSSLVVLSDKAHFATTTLCQSAPITLFLTLLLPAIKSLQLRPFVQILAKLTQPLTT